MGDDTDAATGDDVLARYLPPAKDGPAEWYHSEKALVRTCNACGQVTSAVLMVLAYRADLDPLQMHPWGSRWRELGWLGLWECTACADQSFQPMSRARVADWGRVLGGWSHFEPNEEGTGE